MAYTHVPFLLWLPGRTFETSLLRSFPAIYGPKLYALLSWFASEDSSWKYLNDSDRAHSAIKLWTLITVNFNVSTFNPSRPLDSSLGYFELLRWFHNVISSIVENIAWNDRDISWTFRNHPKRWQQRFRFEDSKPNSDLDINVFYFPLNRTETFPPPFRMMSHIGGTGHSCMEVMSKLVLSCAASRMEKWKFQKKMACCH